MPEGSYPFPMYSGLLEPEHYKNIGNAIWLFLWCVSSTTSEKQEEGTVWGIVLRNKPMKLSEIGERFGVNDKTVSRWLDNLEQHEYIRVTRAPRGLILSVRNSKKWTDKIVRSHEDEQTEMSDHTESDETKLSDHEVSEQTNMSDHEQISGSDRTEMSDLKDIIKNLIDRWINGLSEDDQKELSSRSGVLTSAVGAVSTGQIDLDRPTIEQRVLQIEKYYMQKNGVLNPVPSDWEHVREVANEAMPLDLVYFFIDLAIARKKATRRRPADKIRLFSYCKTVIFGCWDDLLSYLERAQAKTRVPAVNPEPPKRKSKQQQEIDELERFIREERERGSC